MTCFFSYSTSYQIGIRFNHEDVNSPMRCRDMQRKSWRAETEVSFWIITGFISVGVGYKFGYEASGKLMMRHFSCNPSCCRYSCWKTIALCDCSCFCWYSSWKTTALCGCSSVMANLPIGFLEPWIKYISACWLIRLQALRYLIL